MIATLAALALLAPAQQDAYLVKDHYDKQEVMVPMRDGVKLYTSIYTPKDNAGKHPILLQRTPYGSGPYGDRIRASLGPGREFAPANYVFVYQDVRGRYMSEGFHIYCVPHVPEKKSPKDVDESSDAYDTIQWLIDNVPNNNGRVGVYGVSQPGFYASHSLIDAHPALKAVSPQAPVTDRFVGDDDHRNGALTLAQRFSFMTGFGAPRPEPTPNGGQGFRIPGRDGYKFFLDMGPLANSAQYMKGNVYWSELLEHSNYDSYWKSRGVAQWLKGVKPAVLVVGGWFDAEDLYGALKTYAAINKLSPETKSWLMMGPWSHGGFGGAGDKLGPVQFGSRTGDAFKELQFRFFEHFLKGTDLGEMPKATVFNTGANTWRRFGEWPPRTTSHQALYFAPNAGLTFTEPPTGQNSWVSDPANPVPFTAQTTSSVPSTFMIEDQRFAQERPDVRTFQTPPLEGDLTVAGAMKIDLWVSTTGTDSDWIVKVIDVFPDDAPQPMGGYQMLVRSEVMRGKFRNSLERPEPFVPGKPTRVAYDAQDILHTFVKGHRLMVQVQSSWFPLIDRNPQTFVNIYTAKASDFKTATQTLFTGGTTASRIDLPVLR